MKIVFATNNSNKVKEINSMVSHSIKLISLQEINCAEDIPETASTIKGNAIQKAQYVYDNYGYNCFADDTGLEIDALNGEPGVYSARYAGPEKDANNNMNLVLKKLEEIENRKARFITVIALIIDGQLTCFEGIVEGKITTQKSGRDGFGYDPIFQPNGYEITFSEMSMEEKNMISHRGRATRKLVAFLEDSIKNT